MAANCLGFARYDASCERKPILLLGFDEGSIRSRIASNTTLYRASYFFSILSKRCARSLSEANIPLSLTNARMMAIFLL